MKSIDTKFVKIELLKKFIIDTFLKIGVSYDDASITADILIAADRRSILSHGTTRLDWYVDGIIGGYINRVSDLSILKETLSTAAISGNNGLGQVIAYKSMQLIIEKAKNTGVAMATIKDSNHFGIAGYYAMMALKHDLIGVAMTNSSPLVVPTHAKNLFLGTNPIAVAIPTKRNPPWVLDMATSTVPLGKLEICARHDKEMPLQWAVDENGKPTNNPIIVLENLFNRKGGGLLPLGGSDESTGGHKGYGLSALVDILSGCLSAGQFGVHIQGYGKNSNAGVCHFVAAINPDCFAGIDEFKNIMDDFIDELHNTQPANEANRIFVHGEKEWISEMKYLDYVELEIMVFDKITAIGKKLGIYFDEEIL